MLSSFSNIVIEWVGGETRRRDANVYMTGALIECETIGHRRDDKAPKPNDERNLDIRHGMRAMVARNERGGWKTRLVFSQSSDEETEYDSDSDIEYVNNTEDYLKCEWP